MNEIYHQNEETDFTQMWSIQFNFHVNVAFYRILYIVAGGNGCIASLRVHTSWPHFQRSTYCQWEENSFLPRLFYAPFSLRQFQKMNHEWSISVYLKERKTFKKEFVTKNISFAMQKEKWISWKISNNYYEYLFKFIFLWV